MADGSTLSDYRGFGVTLRVGVDAFYINLTCTIDDAVDKVSFSYGVCWNSFVRVADACGLTAEQKSWVFCKTAQKAYALLPATDDKSSRL